MAQVADKVMLITGGCQGIGKAIAEFVLEHGGKVAALDIDKKAGDQFTSECAQDKRASSFLFLLCDVSDMSQLKDQFEKAKAHFGRLDIICNNAGVGDELSTFDKVVNINLRAVIQGTMQGIPYLSKEKGGSGGLIVNIGSMAGVVPAPSNPVYTATKFGVVGFTRSFKGVLAAQGIRVNSICPVFVKTALFEKSMEKKGPAFQPVVDRVGIVTLEDVVNAFKAIIEDASLDGDVLAVTRNYGTGVVEFPSFSMRPLKKD